MKLCKNLVLTRVKCLGKRSAQGLITVWSGLLKGAVSYWVSALALTFSANPKSQSTSETVVSYEERGKPLRKIKRKKALADSSTKHFNPRRRLLDRLQRRFDIFMARTVL